MPRKRAEIIRIPRIEDTRGNLSFIEHSDKGVLPFVPQRVYWIYDVPGGRERHGHAFRRAEEVIVALSGSFDVVLTDPDGLEITHHLSRSYYGLYVPAGTWRALRNFSTNSVAMAISSTLYDPEDYIEDLTEQSELSENSETSEPSELSENTELCDDVFARSSVKNCKIIDLPRITHPNGSLTFEQNAGDGLPFHIKRVYYLYDIPGDASRGGHAHRGNYSLIIAAAGSFVVSLSDGKQKQDFFLNRPYRGLLVPPGIWREIDNFSSGAICLVLTSENFAEEDYIRDFDEFKSLTHTKI